MQINVNCLQIGVKPVTQWGMSTSFSVASARPNDEADSGPLRGGASSGPDNRRNETAKQQMVNRRQALLDGPILSTMLKLALPTVIVLVVQSFVGIAETYFVSFLGTDALAGVALVFPVLMLMQMMSNGGIGGGVASAVARAIGAGRKDDADALVLNAFFLALAFGIIFTAGEFLGGRALYRALGGQGDALMASVAYADAVFSGAVLVWIVSLLAGRSA